MTRHIVTVALVLALVSAPSPANAQHTEPPNGWGFGVGGVVIHLAGSGGDVQTLGGPALHASRFLPHGAGFDARVAYFVPTGFYDFTGLSAIVGLSLGVPAGSHLLLLKGGMTAFVGGNSDGSAGGAVGPYAGAGMLLRVGKHAGLHVDGLVRFYAGIGGNVSVGSIVAPSLGATLMVVPGGR